MKTELYLHPQTDGDLEGLCVLIALFDVLVALTNLLTTNIKLIIVLS